MQKLCAALAAALLAAACHPHDGPSLASGRDSVTLSGVTLSSVASANRAPPGDLPSGAAAGTAISAFIHPETRRLLAPSDWPHLERAVIRAHNAAPGTRVEWHNPETGRRGAVVPETAGDTPEGRCLGMDHDLADHHAYVRACRHADGTWGRVAS